MTALAIPDRAAPARFPQVDVLDAWLAGRGENTLRAYRRDLDDFAAFLESHFNLGGVHEDLQRMPTRDTSHQKQDSRLLLE